MAFTNTIATIPGITVPIFVGYLTRVDVSFILHSSRKKVFILKLLFHSKQSVRGVSFSR
jgi:hypothetical protein